MTMIHHSSPIERILCKNKFCGSDRLNVRLMPTEHTHYAEARCRDCGGQHWVERGLADRYFANLPPSEHEQQDLFGGNFGGAV
jgi:hypothetical protein